jgi:hypothetical protein
MPSTPLGNIKMSALRSAMDPIKSIKNKRFNGIYDREALILYFQKAVSKVF